MGVCSVKDCNISYRNNPDKCSFHKLPIDPEDRRKWIRIISRPNWTPTKGSMVCSKHFEKEYIQKRNKYFVLMKGAIPTLFVPVKIKPERVPTSYIHRDISPPPPLPSTSENRKFVFNNSKLLQKLHEKQKQIRNLRKVIKRQAVNISRLKILLGVCSRLRVKKMSVTCPAVKNE